MDDKVKDFIEDVAETVEDAGEVLDEVDNIITDVEEVGEKAGSILSTILGWITDVINYIKNLFKKG